MWPSIQRAGLRRVVQRRVSCQVIGRNQTQRRRSMSSWTGSSIAATHRAGRSPAGGRRRLAIGPPSLMSPRPTPRAWSAPRCISMPTWRKRRHRAPPQRRGSRRSGTAPVGRSRAGRAGAHATDVCLSQPPRQGRCGPPVPGAAAHDGRQCPHRPSAQGRAVTGAIAARRRVWPIRTLTSEIGQLRTDNDVKKHPAPVMRSLNGP